MDKNWEGGDGEEEEEEEKKKGDEKGKGYHDQCMLILRII